MEIIKSNTPDYFAEDEIPVFKDWLVAQEDGKIAYPVSEKEFYFVLEENNNVIGCAGYLLLKDSTKTFLSWGMVHRKFQKLGYGKKLLEHRFDSIAQNFPNKTISLATTQEIAPFFEKYGFKPTEIKPKYFSKSMDRYEMEI
jgi:N-acetylglutamate synthase-like GNAT family acetyltransferase